MDSEDTETVISKDDKISTAEEEIDKKFVSQAVAFVIGHTRNGFVALCASVATLLKEQAKLKLENESLKQQISLLQCKQSENFNSESKSILSETNQCEHLFPNGTLYSDASKLTRLKRKVSP
ncbi:CAP-Gly domain-containing protein [Nephila pilipes]|uniref:CAP-Gly domain-containing protein n=1 Tax=Nephila pilipes TaxID=299642 RepID=A0A8X6N1M8_NEPPI|nr:CAP-Gly domain-containing protein [Nephila pilipes]